jgi:hypothetical protein
MNDKMGRIGITGFGDMDFVAGPGRAAFVAGAGVGVLGSVETDSGGWQVGNFVPSDDVSRDEELMHPGLLQSLDSR